MTKILSMVSHKIYNLNANESLVKLLTPKLITWFIGGFTLKMKSQSIAYLLNESEYIYDLGPWRWSALNMGYVDKWPLRMQGQWFFWSRAGGRQFPVGSKKYWISRTYGCPCRNIPPLEKFMGDDLTSSIWNPSEPFHDYRYGVRTFY
jgi:hypothetical protein